jgi:hypothetical protein
MALRSLAGRSQELVLGGEQVLLEGGGELRHWPPV